MPGLRPRIPVDALGFGWFWVQALGFGVQGIRFWVQALGFGFRVGFCCNAPFLSEGGFRVWGSGFGFKGLGFEVLVENQMEKRWNMKRRLAVNHEETPQSNPNPDNPQIPATPSL